MLSKFLTSVCQVSVLVACGFWLTPAQARYQSPESQTYRCDLGNEPSLQESQIPLPTDLRFRVKIIEHPETQADKSFATVESWTGTFNDPKSIQIELVDCQRLESDPSLKGELVATSCNTPDQQLNLSFLLSENRKSLAYAVNAEAKTMPSESPTFALKDPRLLNCHRELKWSDFER